MNLELPFFGRKRTRNVGLADAAGVAAYSGMV